MAKPPDNLDLDFLPPRAAALLRVGHKKTYLAQKIIFLFFVFFMVWAYFSELHEVTKGTGKIISSTHLQTINNLEGGIVKEILVKDGQVVSQGQILVRLDTTISQSRYMQDLENFYRFLATSERLRAQIANMPSFIPSEELMLNAPNLALEEQKRFNASREKKQNEMNIANKDYEIKKQELKESKAKLEDAKQQYDFASEQVKIIKPLVDKKIYSKIDYIKTMRDLVEQEAQLKLLKVTVNRQMVAVKQAKDRRDQVKIRDHNDDLTELRDVEGKLAEARAAQTADRDRVTRTEIRSPIMGTIRDLKIRTVGGVIQPGEAILDIVPLNDTLVVEAQIAPGDVGFLHKGMHATIKVTAFDFGSYGGLDAIVEQISADTITDKRDQTYYRVLLQTNSNFLVKNGKAYPILPGMQVEVDILTGRKSVWNYFMKPFTRALQNALTER
ncbi:MAG: type secretion rane fusion protein HlyD family [Alphaproteobacteria bacterium]|jgi:adhesin transport system membrane fusion protein|nr:type secretion rane fusion protein HlyD family [Alphaproteobacteria bacterium]MDF3033605.1 type secretion rane fusion protein HlyD family [Alphaproteobacteria bacterium]